MRLYAGAFTHANEGALHVFDYDARRGRIALRQTSSAIANPAFLALHPTKNRLYAVSELSGGKVGTQPPGALASFRIVPVTGELERLNQQPAEGPRPCHVSLDATGQVAFVANYRGACITTFPLDPTGRVGPASMIVRHEGSSVIPERQECSHPHSCIADPTNRWVYVADLGTDTVTKYDLDLARGGLMPETARCITVQPGSGPRHMKFRPDGRFAYLTNEMGGSVTVFAVSSLDGALVEVETVDTLPIGYDGPRWNSEIAISSSGAFLYAANRGHDSLAIFSIAGGSGRLTLVGHQPTFGKTPRHFALDPAGAHLLVANQDSASIVTFEVDQQSGLLARVDEYRGVPSPVCLLFSDREELS